MFAHSHLPALRLASPLRQSEPISTLAHGCINSMLATVLAVLAISSMLHAVPAPKKPPALRSIHMEQQRIPMPDGVRLSATLYMPDSTKAGEKFPALLEYLPYRKDDATAARDYPVHSWFAAHGYVSVRVDIRGFGTSEGVPTNREYSEQEQLDGEQVIAWLASQPWSSGKVGMFGISWGGFNSIQLAMRRPPALKAIIAVDATEQLFHDDVHYVDGMMHFDEFELNMDLAPGMTGAPDYTLDEKILGPRFDSAPWSLMYFKHQRDGEFWRAPLRPLSEIKIPCFLIGGLLDGYRDSIPKMFEQVKAPIKAIIGPWNHTFPNEAEPGPQIEWRDQALRWWDQWLKNHNTGIMNEPALSIYMQEWHPPDTRLKDVPGKWRGESRWPPQNVANTNLYLHDGHVLATDAPKTAAHELRYVPSIGVEAGFWWGELLTDPRPVDAFSLVYDSVPLKTDLTILGRPHALLRVSATAPLAEWFARLSDVAPDGTVTQITGAGINGAQRESSSDPKDLVPHQSYSLDIEMHLATWTFPKGHRIRLAVSNALWPMVWPTPYAMTTTLELGGSNASRLVLPLVPPSMYAAPQFNPPEPSQERTDMHGEGFPWPGDWKTERDEVNAKTKVTWTGKSAETYPWGKESDFEGITYLADDNHPEASSVQGEAEITMALKDRTLVWQGHLTLSSDAKNFYYKYVRELYQDSKMLKQKTWEETIPRDHQ